MKRVLADYCCSLSRHGSHLQVSIQIFRAFPNIRFLLLLLLLVPQNENISA